MNKKTAEDMRWHHNRVKVDGQLCHPADGDECKQFDRRFPNFSKEIRNIRLGLSSDGFDPFRDSHAREYTVWPVVVVVYNLPPSMCTKAPYMFMPLLIPGPNDPTKDLHVYLRPLIDELKILWRTGAETYDMFSCTNFMMKAALMWTISDFPALGMLSGWSTKGKLACHICMGQVKANQLKHVGKPSFYGTARYFLESDDPLRRFTKFGRTEAHSVTYRYPGSLVRSLCEDMQFPPSGKTSWRKPRDYGMTHNWTHFSPFFELPYWETLTLRHNIDVMHTEKNVFENIFFTMIGDTKKTKDNRKAREDCKELGVHRELWIQDDGTMPNAPYVLSRDQLLKLFRWIYTLQLPDGYASNISRLVQKQYPHYNDAEKDQFQKDNFLDWFERRVQDDGELKDKFIDLIRGPIYKVESYKTCKCNGYKFACGNSNELTSSNSGVVVIGTSYKESHGNNYGRLQEVLKLRYRNGHEIVVFKCHWFDHTRHVKIDRNRMTTVDVKSKLNAEDVFVLASQAHQVYYAPNIANPKSSWYTILTTKSRQVDESVTSREENIFNDDAFQNEESNASSSHVERVVVDDPINFFIDLTMFENNHFVDDYEEEQNARNKENQNEDMNIDDGSDNDDLT
ncbi:uncharacterized protein LOC141660630 [Apium graveolens]|uniref:uncharacterized protein LOC141660630 n=1 Tax=Apium graveolens TaxID=4045 RepID=UPI003D7BC869